MDTREVETGVRDAWVDTVESEDIAGEVEKVRWTGDVSRKDTRLLRW